MPICTGIRIVVKVAVVALLFRDVSDCSCHSTGEQKVHHTWEDELAKCMGDTSPGFKDQVGRAGSDRRLYSPSLRLSGLEFGASGLDGPGP